jgi:tRNA threonylcarbamoyladenosine biosynthesis protein TsaE
MESIAIALPTRRSTVRLGGAIAAALEAGDFVVLSGGLGAGKTFLARGICRSAGVPANVPVTSPTFTLVHEHDARYPIAHADLYRIANAADVVELGLRDRRAEGAVLLVEWGEPFIAELGGDALVVALTIPKEGGPRTATLTATGPRSAEIVRAIQSKI